MSNGGRVTLEPIRAVNLPEVGRFLHQHLNSRVTADAWQAMATPTWQVDAPNHGFMLREGDGVVGVHLAFYADRMVHGRLQRFCNLAAWCVVDGHRAHGIRLLRALLAQPGYHFTDFSPSGNVVSINRRLKFRDIDTATALVPNLPLPARRGAKLVTDDRAIQGVLTGVDLQRYRDHRGAKAAHQFVVLDERSHCHVVARRTDARGSHSSPRSSTSATETTLSATRGSSGGTC